MGIPTTEELEQALEVAIAMREQGQDDSNLAKCLLNLNYRVGLMEKVIRATKLYLHSGEGSREHTELLKALRDFESHVSQSTDDLEQRSL